MKVKIRNIIEKRVRYGYCGAHFLLKSLQLRNKIPERRVKPKLKDDRKVPAQNNETWAMEFLRDQLATGTKIRIMIIVDTFSRFSPIVNSHLSYWDSAVVQILKCVRKNVRYPKTILVENIGVYLSGS